jgi:hypothetical protein
MKRFSMRRDSNGAANGAAHFFFSIAFLIASMAPTIGQDFESLNRTLHAAGYQLYIPPRQNWGPGFVFAGEIVNDRITNVEEICPNLYADLGSPEGAAVVLGDYRAADTYSFGLTLDFLKGLLGGALDLGRVERERTADVRWHNVREISYSHMDQWLETGEPRPIAKRCRLAIEDLQAKNRFKGRIFVIVRAIAPESLIFDFSRAINTEVGPSVKFSGQLKVAAQGKGEIKNDTLLEVKQRLFIGYAPPVKIQDWLPTGLVSGEIIRVRGAPTSLVLE